MPEHGRGKVEDKAEIWREDRRLRRGWSGKGDRGVYPGYHHQLKITLPFPLGVQNSLHPFKVVPWLKGNPQVTHLEIKRGRD
jgi:hypothetical protein